MTERTIGNELLFRPLLLPAPRPFEGDSPDVPHPRPRHVHEAAARSQVHARARAENQLDVLREQRDGLARVQARLIDRIRRLQAENEQARKQLERYRGYPAVEQQEEELAEAKVLEEERGIVFDRLPEGVYPGKPYVTQLDLIRKGVTTYSRQNLSRLTRTERAVPALPVADRVLLPPGGVRALLERERAAVKDASPLRRPGARRASSRRTH